MARDPVACAAWTMVSGVASDCSLSRLWAFEMSPILAELTREVTAGGAERQHRRAWQKMVQRLFLDRVDAESLRNGHRW